MTEQAVETKAFIDVVVRLFKTVLQSDQLKGVVDLIVRRNYNKGLSDVDEHLKLEVNVVPNKDAIDFISQYTFDNIKGMTDEIAEDLRQELTRGFMANEGSAQLKQRVLKVMDVGRNRAAMIARTESHRAYNAGAFTAAKQSGLKLRKEWFNPSPKSEMCKTLAGTVIDMDDKFTYKGESFVMPPGHVSCRSRLLFVQEASS